MIDLYVYHSFVPTRNPAQYGQYHPPVRQYRCRFALGQAAWFPSGFVQNETRGLDYHEFAKLTVHENFDDCLKALEGRRIFALTTKGSTRPDEVSFREGDVLLFGPETRGLPAEVLDSLPAGQKIRLPMMPGSRSMNLSNTVAVILFEAWRQNGFAGGV